MPAFGVAQQPWLSDSQLLSQTTALGTFGQTAKPPAATFGGRRIGSLFQGFAAVVSSNMAVDELYMHSEIQLGFLFEPLCVRRGLRGGRGEGFLPAGGTAEPWLQGEVAGTAWKVTFL